MKLIAHIVGWGGDLQDKVVIFDTTNITTGLELAKSGKTVFFSNKGAGGAMAYILAEIDDSVLDGYNNTTFSAQPLEKILLAGKFSD